jgi:hypothetical protein
MAGSRVVRGIRCSSRETSTRLACFASLRQYHSDERQALGYAQKGRRASRVLWRAGSSQMGSREARGSGYGGFGIRQVSGGDRRTSSRSWRNGLILRSLVKPTSDFWLDSTRSARSAVGVSGGSGAHDTHCYGHRSAAPRRLTFGSRLFPPALPAPVSWPPVHRAPAADFRGSCGSASGVRALPRVPGRHFSRRSSSESRGSDLA